MALEDEKGETTKVIANGSRTCRNEGVVPSYILGPAMRKTCNEKSLFIVASLQLK
jgi:hypothetical protein